MKVSELKEGMFIVVNDCYNYGSLGKYISHTIEKDEDEDGVFWCNVNFSMFIEICDGSFCDTYKEYTMNFFCTVEDGEYVTDDIEEIKISEDVVRCLYYNDDIYRNVHIFKNKNNNYVLIKMNRDRYFDVKVICDRARHVVNDMIWEEGYSLAGLRMTTDEEKDRLWEIVRTRSVDWR